MKNRFLVGVLAAGALMLGAGAAAPAMAAGNILANGSFSEPVLATSTSYNVGQSIPGWAVVGANGYHTTAGLYVEHAPTGAQSGNVLGTISQSFPTEGGKTYTVTYSLFAGKSAQDPTPLGNVPLTATLSNGSTVLATQTDKSRADGGVLTPTFSFTATSATTKVTFSTPYMAAGIDNVSVTEVPVNDSPIMIPALAGGLGIAAIGATGIAMRRKKQLARA